MSPDNTVHALQFIWCDEKGHRFSKEEDKEHDYYDDNCNTIRNEIEYPEIRNRSNEYCQVAYGFIRNRPKVASINLFSLSLSPFSCTAVPVINGHHHHEHSTIGFFFLLFHIIHKRTNSNVHKYKGDSSSSTSSWNFSIP